MNAKELFNELGFKLTTTDDKWLIYTYETDYEKMYVHFYLNQETYEIQYMRFIDNTERTFVPMAERPENTKHSAFYGHWQKCDFKVWGRLHNAIHQQLVELGWI